jgi:hypothetical protein
MADSKISQLTGATTPLAGTEVLPIVQSGSTKKVSVANLTAGRSVSASVLTTTGEISSGGAIRITGAYGTNAANQLALQSSAGVSGMYLNGSTTGSANRGTFVMWQQDSAGGNYLQTLGIDVSANVTFNSGNLVQGTAAKGVNFTANTGAAGMTSQLLNWYEEGTWTPTQGAGLTVVGTFSSSGTYTRVGRLVTIFGALNGSTSIAAASGGVITSGYPFTVATATAGGATTSNLAGCVTYVGAGGSSVMYANAALAAAGAIIVTASYYV